MGDDIVLSVSTGCSGDAWVLDSACSYHMTPRRDGFITYQSISGEVLMRNNMTCKVLGIGTVRITMYDGVVRILSNVRHVLDLRKNLLSLGIFDSQGYKYTSEGGVLRISKGVLVFIKGKLVNGFYMLQGSTIVGVATISSSIDPDSDNTHLGHMSEVGMSILSKQGLLHGQKIGKLDFCEHCIFGKQCRVKFNIEFLVYFLKYKSDVFVTLKQYKTLIEKQTCKRIKCLWIANGLDYCLGEFDEFCKNRGIVRHRTIRRKPQQIGVVERINITLLERAHRTFGLKQ